MSHPWISLVVSMQSIIVFTSVTGDTRFIYCASSSSKVLCAGCAGVTVTVDSNIGDYAVIFSSYPDMPFTEVTPVPVMSEEHSAYAGASNPLVTVRSLYASNPEK